LAMALVCAQCHAEITVLANESMPYCGLIDGKPAGMAVEILNAASLVGAPRFRFDFSRPWARAQLEVLRNPQLAIIPFSRSKEREAHYQWIAVLWSSPLWLATSDRQTELSSIAQAHGLRIGVLRASPFKPLLLSLGLNNLNEVPDENSARMLHAGHIDAWAVSAYVGAYLWKKIGQPPATLHFGPQLGAPFELYIAASPHFSVDDARAISIALKRVRSDGTLAKILAKYRTPQSAPRVISVAPPRLETP